MYISLLPICLLVINTTTCDNTYTPLATPLPGYTCCYTQKSKSLSLFLSVTSGYLGIDRYYLGYTDAVYKLIFTLTGGYFTRRLIWYDDSPPNNYRINLQEKKMLFLISVMCMITAMYLYIYDIVMISKDNLPDYLGVPLR